jgi:hypothetical protein
MRERERDLGGRDGDGGDLLAFSEVDRKAFDPERQSTVVARGMTDHRGGGTLVGSRDASFPF